MLATTSRCTYIQNKSATILTYNVLVIVILWLLPLYPINVFFSFGIKLCVFFYNACHFYKLFLYFVFPPFASFFIDSIHLICAPSTPRSFIFVPAHSHLALFFLLSVTSGWHHVHHFLMNASQRPTPYM